MVSRNKFRTPILHTAPRVFPLDTGDRNNYRICMKTLLGMLFTLLLFIIIIGGGTFIWYLSHTAEFSQKPAPTASETASPPTNH